jgi:hypothetical protein
MTKDQWCAEVAREVAGRAGNHLLERYGKGAPKMAQVDVDELRDALVSWYAKVQRRAIPGVQG